jgi:hypothetical protein
MKSLAISMTDALHRTDGSLDIEATRRPNSNSANINSNFLPFSDDSFNNISGLKTLNWFLCFGLGSWKPKPINQTHLTTTPTTGGYEERLYAGNV